MACFCFRSPAIEETNLPVRQAGKAPLKRDAVGHGSSRQEGSAKGSTSKGKQVDRESPVSVLSGPGEDSGEVEKKRQAGSDVMGKEQEAGATNLASVVRQQAVQDLAKLKKKPVDARPPGWQCLKLTADVEHSQREILPGDPRLLPYTAASEQRLKRRAEQRGKEREYPSGPPGPASEKEASKGVRLDPVVLRQQQLRHGNSHATSTSYATALPGRSRILAWLGEADVNFATVCEADNTPQCVSGSDAGTFANQGQFLSSLEQGSYEDLAGPTVTREMLIDRAVSSGKSKPPQHRDSSAKPHALVDAAAKALGNKVGSAGKMSLVQRELALKALAKADNPGAGAGTGAHGTSPVTTGAASEAGPLRATESEDRGSMMGGSTGNPDSLQCEGSVMAHPSLMRFATPPAARHHGMGLSRTPRPATGQPGPGNEEGSRGKTDAGQGGYTGGKLAVPRRKTVGEGEAAGCSGTDNPLNRSVPCSPERQAPAGSQSPLAVPNGDLASRAGDGSLAGCVGDAHSFGRSSLDCSNQG